MSRTAKARRRWTRRLAALAAVVIAAIGAVYVASERSLSRRDWASAESVDSPVRRSSSAATEAVASAELLDRGRHLVTVVAQCTHCHGPDLAGRELADDPWIGRLAASNLTRGEGGVGGLLSDTDWVAALRRGVNREGRSLLLMPSAQLARLSDRDLEAIVAYVRQVPPVDRVWPERHAGWLTRVVVAAGLAPDLISAEQVAREAPMESAVVPSATPEYGEYLVALGSCRVCHRADLAGGLHPLSLPGEPVPPALTGRGAIAGWSRDEFARAMREGATPDGRMLDREFMPWPTFAGLADIEVDALWLYLAGLRETGAPGGSEATAVASSEPGPSRG